MTRHRVNGDTISCVAVPLSYRRCASQNVVNGVDANQHGPADALNLDAASAFQLPKR